MRRFIAVFLFALLPFQFSWSAVAVYCTHESTTAQAKHLGHHEHKHEAKSEVSQANGNAQTADQFDTDCLVCHGVGIGALTWSSAPRSISPQDRVEVQPWVRLIAMPATPPERPQWTVLA